MERIIPVLLCAVTWYDANGNVVAAGQFVLPDREFATQWAEWQLATDKLPYTYQVSCVDETSQPLLLS